MNASPSKKEAAASGQISLRVAFQLVRFGWILATAGVQFLILRLRGKMQTHRARALWLQRICRRLVKMLDLRLRYRGEPAKSGAFIFNHVSYLDIIALSARDPVIFVAKKEVESWPVIGWVAAAAGTLFIDRSRRADVARVSAQMSRVVAQGVRVCIFPEGTSSDGRQVLPFRTSLLEPLVSQGWPLTAGWIGYKLESGSVENEVCYWGEMSFGSHFVHLLSKPCIYASVAYSSVQSQGSSRKELGRELHGIVSDLATTAAE